MSAYLSSFLDVFMKIAGVSLVANEIRGLVLAGPVLYGLYQSGGGWVAAYLAICALGGIALSVVIPIVLIKKVRSVQLAFASDRGGASSGSLRGR